MTRQADKAAAFLAAHRSADGPLLMPNAWDEGAARLLEHLGFQAIATTSSGYAGTRGRLDGDVTRAEVLEHVAVLVGATTLPVSADLEDGFAATVDEVAETYGLAIDAGLAGGSIEDYTRHPEPRIHPIEEAAERVRAAAEAVHADGRSFVLTARAENGIRNVRDLDDTIRRLQAYQEAGADVLFAPGWVGADEVRSIVESVDLPVNVLLGNGAPTVTELGQLGVARISVGGSLYWTAVHAAVAAAQQLLEEGTLPFDDVAAGVTVGRSAYATIRTP